MLDMGSDNIVFDVVNHLLLSRVTPLLTLFENLIVTKHSPNDIINAMVSQLFNLKITKTAIDSGLNPYRIMGELGLNENFYIYNRMVLENITLRKIDTLLENLYTLDYNILVGIVHNSYGLKTFLLENV
jgi:DNA polymerase III delta subunit